jgi:hypothetical protein
MHGLMDAAPVLGDKMGSFAFALSFRRSDDLDLFLSGLGEIT